LPHTYALKNRSETAHELTTLYIDSQYRMATFDIKDLYVKLPIRNIIDATTFWLSKHHTQPLITKQITTLIPTVLNQNYFQCNQQNYKSQIGIAMGSPVQYYGQILFTVSGGTVDKTLVRIQRNNLL
jgi:hypothetical protein